MAANIFEERLVTRQPAWHGLGLVIGDQPMTAVEAIGKADLDFGITKQPLYIEIGGEYIGLEKYALVRDATGENGNDFLGICGENYGLIQNRDIAQMVDKYLGKDYPLETVGALGKGETIFFSLDAGQTSVANEEIKQYWLLTDTRDGGTAARLVFSPVRTVCENTLLAAIDSATFSVSIAHSADAGAVMEGNVEIIAQMRKAQKAVLDGFRSMTKVKLVENQIDQILKATYPRPRPAATMMRKAALEEFGVELNDKMRSAVDKAEKKYAYRNNRSTRYIEQAKELYNRFNDEYPKLAQTPWAAWNAIVEHEDYRQGRSDVSAAESALLGKRADFKRRGYVAAIAVAEGREVPKTIKLSSN